jgi:hypothetical protein
MRLTHPYLLDGSIRCLRDGCYRKVIPLESSKDANAGDGGITRGFGAFTAYQVTTVPPNEYSCLTCG